jgi:hypothetical protein
MEQDKHVSFPERKRERSTGGSMAVAGDRGESEGCSVMEQISAASVIDNITERKAGKI